jgi:hypothetical protein
MSSANEVTGEPQQGVHGAPAASSRVRRRAPYARPAARAGDSDFKVSVASGRSLTELNFDPAATLFVGHHHYGQKTFIGVARLSKLGKKYATLEEVEVEVLSEAEQRHGTFGSDRTTVIIPKMPLKSAGKKHSMLGAWTQGRPGFFKNGGGVGVYDAWEPWAASADGSYEPLSLKSEFRND